jgi:pimeloyl-ACP methyl ester carboxylesterase
MPAVKVGDINIYYEVHGKGEALVLIMGYTASTAWWFQEVPIFSRTTEGLARVTSLTCLTLWR